MRSAISLFACVVVLLASAARAQDASTPDGSAGVGALVDRGHAAFREASSLREEDPARARELYAEAIDDWVDAMETGGFANGKLHYNIANAHLLRDEVGLAILHYRYARALLPGDRNVATNLAQARLRVPGRSSGSSAVGALETVLFFHYGLAERTRFVWAIGAFALTWAIAGLVTLRIVPRGALWLVGASCVVWIAAGASLAVESMDETRHGVIVGSEVVGRKGPDAEGYEPSFTRPIAPGMEFTHVESRGEWVLIRLADGRRTWVPARSVRFVDSLVPSDDADPPT